MKCLIYVSFSINHNILRETIASYCTATKHAGKEKGVNGGSERWGRKKEGGKERGVDYCKKRMIWVSPFLRCFNPSK